MTNIGTILLDQLLRHRQRYVALVARWQGRDDGEDIVQEVALRVIESPPESLPVSPDLWLCQTARALSHRQYRRLQRRRAAGFGHSLDALPDGETEGLADTVADPTPGPETQVLAAAALDEVSAAIGRLTPRQQELLLLVGQGYSWPQIARILGYQTYQGARASWLLARQRLIDELGEQVDELGLETASDRQSQRRWGPEAASLLARAARAHAAGATLRQAAEQVGISWNTLEYWRRRHGDLWLAAGGDA